MKGIITKVSNSIFFQSQFFRLIPTKVRIERIRRVLNHGYIINYSMHGLMSIRILLFFFEHTPPICMLWYLIYVCSLQLWIYFFNQFMKRVEFIKNPNIKVNLLIIEQIENLIGIFTSILNVLNFIFPIIFLSKEDELISRGICSFLPINFAHMTEYMMIQPELHSVLFTSVFVILYGIFGLAEKFTFTNLFYFMGACNSFFVSYFVSYHSNKVYENVIQRKKYKLQTKDEVIHSLHDPIVLLNNNSQIIFKNEAFQQFEKDDQTLNHLDSFQSLIDDDKKTLQDNISHIIEVNKEKDFQIEKFFQFRSDLLNDIPKSFWIKIFRKHFKSLNALGIAIIIKDLGEEINLKVSQKAKELTNMMLYSLSHEVRTPINGMNGVLSIVLTKVNEDLKKIVLMGISCGEFLSSQIDSFKDYAQIIKEEFAIHGEYFHIIDFLSKIKDIGMNYLAEKLIKLSIVIQVDSNLPKQVYGDSQRIKQILMNLLLNSIKYTEEGFIIISVKKVNQFWISFSVIDTGIGFTSEQIEILKTINIDKFEILSTDFKTFPGFKLTISQMILSIYHSKIEPHFSLKGSHLSFLIPQRDAHSQFNFKSIDDSVALSDSIYPVSSNYDNYKIPYDIKTLSSVKLKKVDNTKVSSFVAQKHVIIVDDMEMNRFVIHQMVKLINKDLNCIEAKNGLEGLQVTQQIQILKEKFIIFMDIEMPVMNGLESSIEIRKFSKAPIIAITAFTSEEIRTKAINAGINLILYKPISKAQLRDILSEFGFEN